MHHAHSRDGRRSDCVSQDAAAPAAQAADSTGSQVRAAIGAQAAGGHVADSGHVAGPEQAAGAGVTAAQDSQHSRHVRGHHSSAGRLAHSERPRTNPLRQRPGPIMRGLSACERPGVVPAL
jgi:hypothetical protein